MTTSKRRSKTTDSPPPLPSVHGRFAVSRGFAREAEHRQGVYEVGGRPTLFDPAYTGQRVPEAVLRHEEVHQNLTLRTFHGVLTLMLSEYAKVATAGLSVAACENTQWFVQELGATYAELAFVQRAAPDAFSASIQSLPSAATKGDPYREAFNFANWLLPLDDAAAHERSDPRTLTIGALCSCSMSTTCLRELASSDFDDARFASWIRGNSPDARLERIGRAVGPAVFAELAKISADRFSRERPTQRRAEALFGELSNAMLSHVPELTAESLSDLEEQAAAAAGRLRNTCPDFAFDIQQALHPTGALFTESPEKRRLLEQHFKFDDLATGN